MAGIIIRQGENTLQAAASALTAEAWADAAAVSAATAEAVSGPTYASTAAGLAATTSGEAFAVAAGGGLVSVYLNSSGTAVFQRTLGSVTSVAVSGGTTGLTTSGGPITSSGTITLGGTLAVANGGTGVTTSTGTGSVVRATSPTLVTPALGAASATSIAAARGAAGTPSHTFTSDLGTGMWSPTADTVAVSTAAAERMRITSTGFVALGNTAPSDRLDVNGRIRSRGSLGINASPPSDFWGADAGPSASLFTSYGNIGTLGSYGFDITANGYRNNINTWTTLNTNGSTSAAQIRLGTADGSIIFGSEATKATGSSFAVTERMRINSSGNVGINEPAPDYKLDINGTFGFTPGSSVTPVDNGDVVFELTNNTTLTIKAKGSDGVVRSGTITLA